MEWRIRDGNDHGNHARNPSICSVAAAPVDCRLVQAGCKLAVVAQAGWLVVAPAGCNLAAVVEADMAQGQRPGRRFG